MNYDPAALERVAQRSRRDMWSAVTPDAVADAGLETRRFGPIQATVVRGLPEDRCLNRIQGAAEPGAAEGGSLRAAVAWMRSQEVDYSVQVATSRPGRIKATAWLGQREFEATAGSVRFVRAASAIDPPDDSRIKIYKLGEEEGDQFGLTEVADDVFELGTTAEAMLFSLPEQKSWRCYTASLRDHALAISACGVMFMHDGIAQLGLDATIDTARGEGLNEALLRRRLIDAAEEGCHTVIAEIVESDSEGVAPLRHNLLKLGFKEAYTVQHWTRPSFFSSGQDAEAVHWLPI